VSEPLQPTPNPDTAGFWEATTRGELALSWCSSCDRYIHPPVERCTACAGPIAFRAVTGKAHLHSYIVVHRAVAPGYDDRPVQVIGLVELADQAGLRLTTQLVDVDPDDVRIGMALEVRIVDLPGGNNRIPVFGPR
jgi:hypothetical protein